MAGGWRGGGGRGGVAGALFWGECGGWGGGGVAFSASPGPFGIRSQRVPEGSRSPKGLVVAAPVAAWKVALVAKVVVAVHL